MRSLKDEAAVFKIEGIFNLHSGSMALFTAFFPHQIEKNLLPTMCNEFLLGFLFSFLQVIYYLFLVWGLRNTQEYLCTKFHLALA